MMSDQEESNKLSEDEHCYDFTLSVGKFDLFFYTGIFSIQLKFCGIP